MRLLDLAPIMFIACGLYWLGAATRDNETFQQVALLVTILVLSMSVFWVGVNGG